jgi:type III pantothenate kinase
MTVPLLAIDAGNTRIKWGVFERGQWNPCGAIPTADANRVGSILKGIAASIPAYASNVAGAVVEDHLVAACHAAGRKLTLITSRAAELGVYNGYREPGRLGPDRWAGLIAARHGHPGHQVVVNAGTALTVDALAADGRFLGGLIVAGPALMRRSLGRGTAGLRLTEGVFDKLPKATPDAITTGALQACVGAIERMRGAMAEAGCAAQRIVLSGGAAGEIRPHLSGEVLVEENLVLDGLRLIAAGD